MIRYGTYGKATANPRQRYLCSPADGSRPHVFTPALPRDHVHEGSDRCEHCEELRGVHRGDTAVARRHTWSTRIVARGLEQLALGSSYAEVSRWAIRATGVKRTRAPNRNSREKKRRKTNASSRESRNTWHIAADWTESFAPVIFESVDRRLRAKALADRQRLDVTSALGCPAVRPQVWLLDEVPVYGRELDQIRSSRTRRDTGYSILVAAEVHWTDGDEESEFWPVATEQLRLVRAFPNGSSLAWRILFDELGYTPDFIVADAAPPIITAVEQHFDGQRTRLIPSMWHMKNAIRGALPKNATVANADGNQLLPDLEAHFRTLASRDGALANVKAWKAWWDTLEKLLRSHKLPLGGVKSRRKTYEARVSRMLGTFNRHRTLPLSTGGLEAIIQRQIQPLLAGRRSGFGNIERTNNLLDLVVARANGAFDNLNDVAKLLREDAVRHEGWTVALRSISDPRPPGGHYSSLRDGTLLTTLAEQRGLL